MYPTTAARNAAIHATAARNAAIHGDALRGVSLTAIARDHRISRQRVWQILHRQQAKAQMAVTGAIESGKLVRPNSCEDCGRTYARPHIGRRAQIESHHDDYSQPLKVRWLCRRCHRRADVARNRHRFQGAGEPHREGLTL